MFATIATTMALAEKWTIETLPMVHLQNAQHYVCNPDGVLSPTAVATTDSMLQALERDKGIQTVVVVVKQLKGDDPYQFGMDLSRKYGIGSKEQRSGLIVILATEDRSYQILTGNGLEGALPDAICRRIQNQVMVPALKAGDWNSAIVNTIKRIDNYVRKDNSLTAENGNDDDSSAAVAGFIIALLFIIAISYIFAHRTPRCPKCKTRMRKVSSQRVRASAISDWKIRTIGNVPSAGIKQHTIPTQATHTTATPFRPYCLAVAAVGVHSVEEVSEALLAAAPLAAAEAAAGFDKQIQRTDIFQTNNKRI